MLKNHSSKIPQLVHTTSEMWNWLHTPSVLEFQAKRSGKKYVPTDTIASNAEQKIAELVFRVNQGDNHALRHLALIASSICETLEEVGNKDLARTLVLTRSLPVWPTNIADVPNLPKGMTALVKKLQIGQSTEAPYNVPRSRRKPSPSKTVATKLITIFDSFATLCQAEDVLGEAEAGVKHSRVQPPTQEDLHMLTLHRDYLKQCLQATSDLLTKFAKFLGVRNPYAEDEKAVFDESIECYSIRLHRGADASQPVEKCLEILTKFAGPDLENVPALSKIGTSKKKVSVQTYGKQSKRQDDAHVRGGIKGEIRQAFEAICGPDGEYGRPRNVWGYLGIW